MRMTPLISLGASIVLGAGAILLGRMYSGGNSEIVQAEAMVPEQAMVSVLVAAARIEPGEQIEPKHFRTREWPEDLVPSGALDAFPKSQTEIYARTLIVPGEPVFTDKLAMSGEMITLAAAITPGMRAISVEVKIDSGVSGFVLPGDRVDVNEVIEKNANRRSRGDGYAKDFTARRVLANVKVLAVDQTFESDLEGAMPSKTVTLEVTPEQALAVGIANERGSLGLALIGREEVIAGPPVAAKPTPQKPRARRTAYVPRAATTTRVRVINGAQETEVEAPVSSPKPSQPTNLLGAPQ